MKLSVYNERGYRNVSGQVWRVTMDGRPLDHVVKVDTCSGVAWVMDTEADGSIRLNRNRDEIVLRRVLGPMRAERVDAL